MIADNGRDPYLAFHPDLGWNAMIHRPLHLVYLPELIDVQKACSTRSVIEVNTAQTHQPSLLALRSRPATLSLSLVFLLTLMPDRVGRAA